MHKVTLVREMPKRPRTPLKDQIDFIVGVALRGNRGTSQGWTLAKSEKEEVQQGGKWVFVITLSFKKQGGRAGNLDVVSRQWDKIVEMVSKAGAGSKFNKYPWTIRGDDESPAGVIAEDGDIKTEKFAPGVVTAVVPERITTIPELREMFPHELLEDEDNSDALIESHPAFKGIYERGPQIRTTLASIWTFIESEGEAGNHLLYWGKPACAKTGILKGLQRLFGIGAILKLDSTSTSRPGLERLVFKKKEDGGVGIAFPPFIFMEEIEKASEETLRMWLGAMDERHEFRKVMHHMTAVREVRFLGFATCNDKDKFDLMMGGKPNDPGALSSRFQHPLECWRPDEATMRRILIRELPLRKAKMEWVDPCIELAREMKTDDPRTVLGFLDGRNRLITGHFQKDQLAMYRRSRGQQP